MKLALIVLAGLVLEIFVWIGVGDLVGSMWYVFFWFVAAFFIGLNMVRQHAAGIMPQLQQMQMGMAMGATDPSLSGNLPKILAGVLLLIPGLLTDLLALLILIPAVQNAFKAAAMNAMMKRQQSMVEKMMGGMGADMGGAQGHPFADIIRQMQDMQAQAGQRDSTIIDGEAREVKPDAQRIEFKDVNKK
jgi:UPF0716 protein FxsA